MSQEQHTGKDSVDRLVFERDFRRQDLDPKDVRPYLAWLPLDRIKATLENTTRFYRADSRLPMRRHFKSRFPDANVRRLTEPVTTDTFFADVPAHDDGIRGHWGRYYGSNLCVCSKPIYGCLPNEVRE